jgi:hypothetical protein
MIPKDLLHAWQNALAEQPEVWVVEVHREWTGNLYDSAEAAEHEVAACKRRGKRAVRAVCWGCLHSVRLSEARWSSEVCRGDLAPEAC